MRAIGSYVSLAPVQLARPAAPRFGPGRPGSGGRQAGTRARGACHRGQIDGRGLSLGWSLEDVKRSVLFHKLPEFLFRNAKLLKDFIKEPSADFTVTMNWNGSRPAIWMFPSSMASLLPSFLNPSFFAARSRSLALAGMDRLQVDVLRQQLSFFFVFLFNHLEDIDKLGLRLFWSSSPGMASRNGWNVGYKGADYHPDEGPW